ncbi:hypothetical protein NEOLI_002270 [Neolecta irregularis DAH-3]|uniref:Uncharacterized protein n=1 Tax=Neolecta irregularis (strain DAH-3) TaxID=1198029 RepID=A0A1U7LK38_NEOID|nr:hypothetical protein NEOLI_002270 [Neolecta irregularis DAH-3]|eukprot:OLL23020.1 hypothetical protein NEOLI_002270 [Neolecta irregularis DAH-3]
MNSIDRLVDHYRLDGERLEKIKSEGSEIFKRQLSICRAQKEYIIPQSIEVIRLLPDYDELPAKYSPEIALFSGKSGLWGLRLGGQSGYFMCFIMNINEDTESVNGLNIVYYDWLDRMTQYVCRGPTLVGHTDLRVDEIRDFGLALIRIFGEQHAIWNCQEFVKYLLSTLTFRREIYQNFLPSTANLVALPFSLKCSSPNPRKDEKWRTISDSVLFEGYDAIRQPKIKRLKRKHRISRNSLAGKQLCPVS